MATDKTGPQIANDVSLVDESNGNRATVNSGGSVPVAPVNVAGTRIDPATSLSEGSVAPGAAATKSELAGGVYSSTPPTLANGQQAALQLDATGSLKTTASVAPAQDIVVTGSLTAAFPTAGSTVTSSVSGYNSHAVVISCAAWTGTTVVFETTSDGGATWTSTTYRNGHGVDVSFGHPVVGEIICADGTYKSNATGAINGIRIKCVTYGGTPISVRLLSSMANTIFKFANSAIIQNIFPSTTNATVATVASPVGIAQNNNLAPGTSWTSASESTLGVAYIQHQFKADQTCCIHLDQSNDGSNWDHTISAVIPAGTGVSHSHLTTAAYYRHRIDNIGSANTTYIRFGTTLCPVASESMVPVGGDWASSFYPNPSLYFLEELKGIALDSQNNLMVRGPVSTDEGSFCDHFLGSSLQATLFKNISFSSGVNIVTSTTDFDSLEWGQYIRLSTDPDSVLTQIWSVKSSSFVSLLEGYLGSSGSGNAVISNWKQTIGTGGNITVGSSLCNIVSGTTASTDTYIFRSVDVPNLQMQIRASVSQRISYQSSMVGFADVYPNPNSAAYFEFSGTDDTKVNCVTIAGGETISIQVTLPGAATSAARQLYEIRLTNDKVSFFVNRVLMFTAIRGVGIPYLTFGLFAHISNTGATSSTTLSLDYMMVLNQDSFDVVAHQSDASKLQMTTNAIYSSIPVALTNGQSSPLQLTAAGELRVTQAGATGPATTGAGESDALRSFQTTCEITLGAAGVESNVFLMRNPSGSMKHLHLKGITFSSTTSGKQSTLRVYSNPILNTQAVTFQDTGDTVTWSGHPFVNGDLVKFATVVTTTGITAGTNYYVVNRTATTWQLALTLSGSPLPLTNNGTGTVYMFGVSLAPTSMNIGGAAPISTGQVTLTPTSTANGSKVSALTSTSETNLLDYDWGLIIQAGNSIMITGTPSANNNIIVINIIWTEATS